MRKKERKFHHHFCIHLSDEYDKGLIGSWSCVCEQLYKYDDWRSNLPKQDEVVKVFVYAKLQHDSEILINS